MAIRGVAREVGRPLEVEVVDRHTVATFRGMVGNYGSLLRPTVGILPRVGNRLARSLPRDGLSGRDLPLRPIHLRCFHLHHLHSHLRHPQPHQLRQFSRCVSRTSHLELWRCQVRSNGAAAGRAGERRAADRAAATQGRNGAALPTT